MPHLVLLYTPNLEPAADIGTMCRQLADAMLAVHNLSRLDELAQSLRQLLRA